MWFYWFLSVFLPLSFVGAAEYSFQGSDRVIVLPKESVYPGSYYKFGESHLVLGTVKGDAYFIGSQIVIEGDIEGNLSVLGGSVMVTGKVLGDMTVIAGEVVLQGTVKGKVICVGLNVEISPSGYVDKNLFLVAGHAKIDSTVQEGMIAVAGNLEIGGTIQGNVRAFASKLLLNNTAKILGYFHYRSQNTAKIASGSIVQGQIKHVPSLMEDLEEIPIVRGAMVSSLIATKVMNFLYTFVVGILFLRFYPKKLHRVLHRLRSHPGGSLLWGIGIVVGIPVVSMILLVSVIGAPFALTLLALNVLGFYTAKVIPILFFSNALFGYFRWKPNKIPTLAVGQVCYYALTSIPVVGWFIAI